MLQENRAGAFSFNQDFRRELVLSAQRRGEEGGGGGVGRGGVRGIQAGGSSRRNGGWNYAGLRAHGTCECSPRQELGPDMPFMLH